MKVMMMDDYGMDDDSMRKDKDDEMMTMMINMITKMSMMTMMISMITKMISMITKMSMMTMMNSMIIMIMQEIMSIIVVHEEDDGNNKTLFRSIIKQSKSK